MNWRELGRGFLIGFIGAVVVSVAFVLAMELAARSHG